MDDIRVLIKEARELEKMLLERLRETVKYIKDNNIKDKRYIEDTLDEIMSINFYDTNHIFSELCNYYDYVDEANSTEYRLMYMNMNKND